MLIFLPHRKLSKFLLSPTLKHDPPYEVRESGYAGFMLPVTVHFKNKETVTFNHDLVLQNDQPTTNVRKEKLTFQSPADDFRKLLLRGGGVSTPYGSGAGVGEMHAEELPLCGRLYCFM